MRSATLFALGGGSLLGSFALPPISLPLQAAAFGLFIASELRCRHEVKFVHPVQQRRHQAWLNTLDHAFEHQTGAAQAYATNRLDWRYRHQNAQLNMSRSVGEKYLMLFTQGRAPQQRTIDVGAEPVGTQPPTLQPPQPQTTRPPQGGTIQPPQPPNGSRPPQPPAPAPQDGTPLLKLESLTNTAFLMIWGTQGGGKTTLAKRIARMREQVGHSIQVADPHGSAKEWGGWTVVGSGRDYGRLNEFLKEYDADITADYELYSDGEREFAWSTLIVDEFTGWADRCPRSAAFVKAACSDIRKIRRCVILISHSDTLAGLGGATGMRAAIDRSAIKLELETEIDLETGEYVATGYGWLQYPGKERVRVQIPHDEPTAQTAQPVEAVVVEVEPEPQKKGWDRFTPEYLQFIKSDEWKEKRLERIKLDTVNGQIICQLCSKPCTDADPPEVDHFRYPPRGATFEDFVNQPIDDLRTLHKSCHQFKTEQSRKK